MYSSNTLPETWDEPDEELLDPAGLRTAREQETVRPRHSITSSIPIKWKRTNVVLIFTIKRDSLGRTAGAALTMVRKNGRVRVAGNSQTGRGRREIRFGAPSACGSYSSPQKTFPGETGPCK